MKGLINCHVLDTCFLHITVSLLHACHSQISQVTKISNQETFHYSGGFFFVKLHQKIVLKKTCIHKQVIPLIETLFKVLP
jgi:hypothetical protein